MKKGLSRVLLSLSFALLSAMGLGAQTVVRDTVVVYFNQGSTDIVPELKGNSEALESIVLAVKRYASVPEFHIYIKGWASPNGSSVFNKSLSEGRASSVLDYVSKQVSWTLPGSSYTLDGKGVDWEVWLRIWLQEKISQDGMMCCGLSVIYLSGFLTEKL